MGGGLGGLYFEVGDGRANGAGSELESDVAPDASFQHLEFARGLDLYANI